MDDPPDLGQVKYSTNSAGDVIRASFTIAQNSQRFYIECTLPQAIAQASQLAEGSFALRIGKVFIRSGGSFGLRAHNVFSLAQGEMQREGT